MFFTLGRKISEPEHSFIPSTCNVRFRPECIKAANPPSANYFQKSHGEKINRCKTKKKKILFITSNLFAQIFLFQNLDLAIISALLNSRYDTIPRIIFIIKTDKKGKKKIQRDSHYKARLVFLLLLLL